jgi:hypothetical protein
LNKRTVSRCTVITTSVPPAITFTTRDVRVSSLQQEHEERQSGRTLTRCCGFRFRGVRAKSTEQRAKHSGGHTRFTARSRNNNSNDDDNNSNDDGQARHVTSHLQHLPPAVTRTRQHTDKTGTVNIVSGST